MSLTLIAGVEIVSGQLGAFAHGHVDERHLYGDPRTAAEAYLAGGAQWLHIGDLDAFSGRGDNHAAVSDVARTCRGRAQFAVAGGIRDQAAVDRALATGARQVLLDPAALADMDFVERTIRAHRSVGMSIVAHGTALWAPGSPVDGTDVLKHLARLDALHCPAYVVDDVDSHGIRKSAGRATLLAAAGVVRGAVIAAGGIDRLEDLHTLAELGLANLTGVVIDRALATGAFTLAEAQAAIEPRYDPYEWGPPRP